MLRDDERWAAYEQALLAALGHASPAGQESDHVYSFLFMPAFHAPGYLSIIEAGGLAELRCAVLLSGNADLFEAAWKRPTETEASVPSSAIKVIEERAVLAETAAAELRAELAPFAVEQMGDVEMAARDGIAMRCWYERPGHLHTFSIHVAGANVPAEQHALIIAALRLARTHLQHPILADYFKAVQRYL